MKDREERLDRFPGIRWTWVGGMIKVKIKVKSERLLEVTFCFTKRKVVTGREGSPGMIVALLCRLAAAPPNEMRHRKRAQWIISEDESWYIYFTQYYGRTLRTQPNEWVNVLLSSCFIYLQGSFLRKAQRHLNILHVTLVHGSRRKMNHYSFPEEFSKLKKRYN